MERSRAEDRRAGIEAAGFDREGDPRAEMADTAHFQIHWPVIGDTVMKGLPDPINMFARQPVEHRQVSMQNVSAWGEVLLAQAIEGLQIDRIDTGGQNEGMIRFQDCVLPVGDHVRPSACDIGVVASRWRRFGFAGILPAS